MGTTIEGVGVVVGGWRARNSALRLANVAANESLTDAGVAPNDIDLLVNCGLYRDRNLGEPALAALIQEDVGISPEDPHAGAHGAFSFDIANGTCGPLTALQIIDRFGRAGTVRKSIVVASDANPGHGLAPDFPFMPVGGALVCGWSDDERGLGEIVWSEWYDDDGSSFRALVGQREQRNVLRFERSAEYAARAGTLAAKVAAQAMSAAGLSVDDRVTVVAAPGAGAFLDAFCESSGLYRSELIAASAANVHTASFIDAFARARRQGRIRRGETVLFVTAAPGIVAGAGIYRG